MLPGTQVRHPGLAAQHVHAGADVAERHPKLGVAADCGEIGRSDLERPRQAPFGLDQNRAGTVEDRRCGVVVRRGWDRDDGVRRDQDRAVTRALDEKNPAVAAGRGGLAGADDDVGRQGFGPGRRRRQAGVTRDLGDSPCHLDRRRRRGEARRRHERQECEGEELQSTRHDDLGGADSSGQPRKMPKRALDRMLAERTEKSLSGIQVHSTGRYDVSLTMFG